jgi:hypothetical protein
MSVALVKENAELRAQIERLERAWQTITNFFEINSHFSPRNIINFTASNSSPSRQPCHSLRYLLSPAATPPLPPSLSTLQL